MYKYINGVVITLVCTTLLFVVMGATVTKADTTQGEILFKVHQYVPNVISTSKEAPSSSKGYSNYPILYNANTGATHYNLEIIKEVEARLKNTVASYTHGGDNNSGSTNSGTTSLPPVVWT